MSSGSKYAVMAETNERRVNTLDVGIGDKVRKKVIESELKRIDDEVNQEIDEIKNTPVDTNLIEEQAKAELSMRQKENRRKSMNDISVADDVVKGTEMTLNRVKLEADSVKETSKEREERANLVAQQEFERTISSIGNVDKTIELRVKKACNNGDARKAQLQAELDNITAKIDAHKEKVDCYNSLYKDLKEISLALGDVGSKGGK